MGSSRNRTEYMITLVCQRHDLSGFQNLRVDTLVTFYIYTQKTCRIRHLLQLYNKHSSLDILPA